MPRKKQTTLTPWTRQGWHAAGLIFLFLLLYFFSLKIGANTIWSLSALISAFLHQGLVVTVWRLELLGKYITRLLGTLGFYLYGTLFSLLLLARFAVAAGAALDSMGTLPLPAVFWWVITAIVLFFFIWLEFSVLRYFGIKRALGADHFFPEYRKMPFVRKGIFRYTPNGMYTFGTLAFMLPGLILRSDIGLAVGIFHYLSVWLHYWATELPDMEHIYGKTP
ncbi:methyltransferase [Dethiobacter alkaliphilus]|uniref:methyltransferase n=1 Tax=Dethiobacter alkaliphilus TaxID=427926 RepID=UPI002227B961|nr:methyltransferase [Dethiobacter alkaliphilus]MCW3489901.1 hypothetical protein [Dethiobacter alkaliphilus]